MSVDKQSIEIGTKLNDSNNFASGEANDEVKNILDNKLGVQLVEVRGEKCKLGPKDYFDKIITLLLDDFNNPDYNIGAIDSLAFLLYQHEGTRNILPIEDEDSTYLTVEGLLPEGYDQHNIMDFDTKSSREEKIEFIKSLSFE